MCGSSGARRRYFGATIDQLVATADSDGELEVVAIDIPIGLPLIGTRQADVLAHGLVGKRTSLLSFQHPFGPPCSRPHMRKDRP
jgi:predicted RNase H-like nuclease